MTLIVNIHNRNKVKVKYRLSMTNFIKFISGSKEYLMIDRRETINHSKISCIVQNYTLANLSEKEVNFVKKKFINSNFESLKFFVNQNKSNLAFECYKLLAKVYDTLTSQLVCPDEKKYNIKSETLCEKHISVGYNTTLIYFYPTTKIVNTSNKYILVIVVGIIILAVVILIIVALYCFKRKRNNDISNEVSSNLIKSVYVFMIVCFRLINV